MTITRAREPSEFEYDTEETDPEDPEDGPEEDDDDAWVLTRHISRVVMIRTKPVEPIPLTGIRGATSRNAKRVGAGVPLMLRRKRTGVRVKWSCLCSRTPLKRGALMYTDWRREVEEYLRKGYDDNQIKDAMLSSVEGQASVNFHSCDEGRNRTPAQFLKEMDSIYNVSVTFWDLNARICGLKQGSNEPIKVYYERMADISVKLEQYHGDHFSPGELKMMKDCFYAGLKEHNKYLVSHMKDPDQYGPAQMLKEIREQEDSHYPANTTPKPHHHDNTNKNPTHYGGKGSPYDKSWTYAVRHTDVQLLDPEQDEPTLPPVVTLIRVRYMMTVTMWP